MESVKLSPLPSDQVRSILIMLAREGQAALDRGPNARQFAAQCFHSAASLARDYAAPPSEPEL
jgi:hypothetical protein